MASITLTATVTPRHLPRYTAKRVPQMRFRAVVRRRSTTERGGADFNL